MSRDRWAPRQASARLRRVSQALGPSAEVYPSSPYGVTRSGTASNNPVVASRTLGVDLASKPAGTAACLISWEPGEAVVEYLEAGIDDDKLNELAGRADRVGIDIPFGWPDAFVAAICAHHNHQPWHVASQDELRYRRTDRFVWRETRRPPLSVSSDKLAIPAFRVASLLSLWNAERTGAGKYVEVYRKQADGSWKVAEDINNADAPAAPSK